jgi:hypothetical protein
VTTFETPNHFRRTGDLSGGWARFGNICSITPVNLPGEGHHAKIAIRFKGGVTVELDAAAADELARRLPAVLAFLPVVPDVSGAAVDFGEAL